MIKGFIEWSTNVEEGFALFWIWDTLPLVMVGSYALQQLSEGRRKRSHRPFDRKTMRLIGKVAFPAHGGSCYFCCQEMFCNLISLHFTRFDTPNRLLLHMFCLVRKAKMGGFDGAVVSRWQRKWNFLEKKNMGGWVIFLRWGLAVNKPVMLTWWTLELASSISA